MRSLNLKQILVEDALLYNGDKFVNLFKDAKFFDRLAKTFKFLVEAPRDGVVFKIKGVQYFVNTYANLEGTNIGLLLNMGPLVLSDEYTEDIAMGNFESAIDSKYVNWDVIEDDELLTPSEWLAFWNRYASWQKVSYNISNISKKPILLSEIYGIYEKEDDEAIHVINRDAKYSHEAMYWKQIMNGDLIAFAPFQMNDRVYNAKIWLLSKLGA
jgi:hypothetical protein